MPPFDGHDDFEDYLGPQWHCYLGDINATIPVPLVFAKGKFESGVAAKRLNEYAANPCPYLDAAAQKKMATAHQDLLRKFAELASDELAEMRWQEFHRTQLDGCDATPVAESGLQKASFESPEMPF